MQKPWISMHIFYSSNPDPLLANCVYPLIARLRSDGLISRYFFIKYWLGGPHIRLRLLPSEGTPEERIKAIAEPEVREYLDRFPALFQIDKDVMRPIYRRLYEAEYGEQEFKARFGEDGDIPFYDTNSFHYIEYEPEYQRYGGEVFEMGLVWRYLWFYPYCKLDYIVLFHKRRHRVYVAAAGTVASLTLMLPFAVIWAVAPAWACAPSLTPRTS